MERMEKVIIETMNQTGCEKQRFFHFKNFDVSLDQETIEILDLNIENNKKQFAEELNKVKSHIDSILGEEWDIQNEKLNIYLFYDQNKYVEFIKKKFPEKYEIYIKDNAIFDVNSKTEAKSIVNYTFFNRSSDITSPSDIVAQKIKESGTTTEQIIQKTRRNVKADILSGIGHEMTHLHPYFGGVGNKDSINKWEQEMICRFTGERIRTLYGGTEFRQELFEKAKKEVENLGQINLEENGKNWEQFYDHEDFFYPYLEKQYGLEKLQNFWKLLFKDRPKKSLTKAIELVYGKNINDIEREFTSAILTVKSCEEIENI